MIGFKDYKAPDKEDIIKPHPTVAGNKTKMYKDELVELIQSFKESMGQVERRIWYNRIRELLDLLN